MTYEGAEYSDRGIFEEIKEAAVREGVTDLVQFRDLIDEIVEEKRIYGFFSDDEDLSQIKENIEGRWPEVKKAISKR
jgi:hypothetical protein